MRSWLHARAMGAIRAVACVLQTLPQKHQRNVMYGLNPPSATRDINKKFMAYARMSAMLRSTCVSYRSGWASTLLVGADPTY